MEYKLRLALLEGYMDLLGGILVDQLQCVASLAFDAGQRKLGWSQLGVWYEPSLDLLARLMAYRGD